SFSRKTCIIFGVSDRLRSSPIRSEEHTSELQSRRDLVCRLLLEKKKTKKRRIARSSGGWEPGAVRTNATTALPRPRPCIVYLVPGLCTFSKFFFFFFLSDRPPPNFFPLPLPAALPI